jgi:hypothetical protein
VELDVNLFHLFSGILACSYTYKSLVLAKVVNSVRNGNPQSVGRKIVVQHPDGKLAPKGSSDNGGLELLLESWLKFSYNSIPKSQSLNVSETKSDLFKWIKDSILI